MQVIERAIRRAALAHKDQVRKSTTIPYITHPFAVGMLLQQAGCTEAVIAAGILHDTVEDTDITLQELEEEFGAEIANLVLAASEPDKTLPWETRKKHTIMRLADATTEEIQVITADKLHNLRSIKEDLQKQGEATWDRFSRGRDDQHWYYSSIVFRLLPRKNECILITELKEEVLEVFGSINTIDS